MKQGIIKLTCENGSAGSESWHKEFSEIDRSHAGARSFAGGGNPKPGENVAAALLGENAPVQDDRRSLSGFSDAELELELRHRREMAV